MLEIGFGEDLGGNLQMTSAQGGERGSQNLTKKERRLIRFGTVNGSEGVKNSEIFVYVICSCLLVVRVIYLTKVLSHFIVNLTFWPQNEA